MRPTFIPKAGAGQFLYAIGFLGLGILGLIFDDYAMNWQPVPSSFPAHDFFAYVSALILLLSGAGLLVQRFQIQCAVLLTAFLVIWLIALRVPPLLTDFFSVINWLGLAETLEMITGGWLLAIALIQWRGNSKINWLAHAMSLRSAKFLFAASLPLIGLSHFVYAKETAQMIPEWIPERLALAYLTGAGHVAAGIALLINVMPRLAITAEVSMMSSFVLLLHVPGVVADPTSRFQWTMLCVAVCITGAATIMMNQFAGQSFGLRIGFQSKRGPRVSESGHQPFQN
jgi:uncharacterized membrane protein